MRRERRRDPSFPIFADALSFNKDELRNVFRGSLLAEFQSEFYKRVFLYCILTPDQNSQCRAMNMSPFKKSCCKVADIGENLLRRPPKSSNILDLPRYQMLLVEMQDLEVFELRERLLRRSDQQLNIRQAMTWQSPLTRYPRSLSLNVANPTWSRLGGCSPCRPSCCRWAKLLHRKPKHVDPI
jgi:hypothetical protein